LDRSRRNANPDQYGASMRQAARAARRATKGLAARQISNPGRARHARTDHAADGRAASEAKHHHGRDIAARIVASHGNTITVEDCTISTWARLWGKRTALCSPGMLVAALAAERAATGGRLHRAGTRSTALSQHCLCAPGCRKPWRSASTAVRRAACAPTATSPRRRWPPSKRGRALVNRH
jgi:hypothetical protein